MGIVVTCGRTSWLKRFLSMPRYLGASRSLMKRGKNSVSELRGEGIADLRTARFRALRDELSLDADHEERRQESQPGVSS
jgi:hypothetical protein